jgi:hypothetical protein
VGTGFFALDNVWFEIIAAVAVLFTLFIFMGFFGVFSRLFRQIGPVSALDYLYTRSCSFCLCCYCCCYFAFDLLCFVVACAFAFCFACCISHQNRVYEPTSVLARPKLHRPIKPLNHTYALSGSDISVLSIERTIGTQSATLDIRD